MKKIIIIALMLISILAFQNPSHAQGTTVGVGNIIFEEKTPDLVTHGFLMNEISYEIVKLHLFIAGKDVAAANYE
jgi:hypothetical protein